MILRPVRPEAPVTRTTWPCNWEFMCANEMTVRSKNESAGTDNPAMAQRGRFGLARRGARSRIFL